MTPVFTDTVFADTFFFLAFINPRDAAHQAAIGFSQNSAAPLITTVWVLTKVADGLAKTPNRRFFQSLLRMLDPSPANEIVWDDPALFRRGADLYEPALTNTGPSPTASPSSSCETADSPKPLPPTITSSKQASSRC
jgi:hypothetical protein